MIIMDNYDNMNMCIEVFERFTEKLALTKINCIIRYYERQILKILLRDI